MPNLSAKLFSKNDITVSHETLEKLELYAVLLRKWQKAINLVGPTTLEDLAERHFLDSAQVIKLLPDKDAVLVDMGSGAGFPGLVLAILGMKNVHLVESDVRKATFLRTVSRETKTPVTIHDIRIERCEIPNVDIITARALATLNDLFKHVTKLCPERPVKCIFLKGEKVAEDISNAEKKWSFDVETTQSVSEKSGRILEITNIKAKA